MDLNYADNKKKDIGALNDYILDLAYGDDENNFECGVSREEHCCEKNYLIYVEGTEYGGMVDDIREDTAKGDITYIGRTWHGILNSKVLEPDVNADYLVLSGEANVVLADCINRMGLNSLFKASEDISGIEILNYQMSRYISGYNGIRKMLKAYGAKLNIIFSNGFAVLSAKPIVDYSQNEQFDKDQIEFDAKKKGNPLNHVICLGKGELAERKVIHVYADENGNISDTQFFVGLDEVMAVYENVNAADDNELRQGGIDKIKEAWSSDELNVSFDFEDENYDIGDIVGATDTEIGIAVRREIRKKIVTISNGDITIYYPSESDNSSGSTDNISSGSSGGVVDIVVADVVQQNNPNPVQSGAVYNHVAEQVGNIEILLGTI